MPCNPPSLRRNDNFWHGDARTMKHCVIFILVFVTIIILCGSSMADSGRYPPAGGVWREKLLSEPVFDIPYDPAFVHFPPAPAQIDHCEDIHHQADQSFTYAHINKNRTDYYWVDGWMKYTPDGPGDWPTMFVADYSGGVIVVLHGTDCRVTCGHCAFTTDERIRSFGLEDGITDEIAAELLQAAIKTEIRAFGGKDALLKRIDAPRHYDAPGQKRQPLVISKQYPLIRAALERLRADAKDH